MSNLHYKERKKRLTTLTSWSWKTTLGILASSGRNSGSMQLFSLRPGIGSSLLTRLTRIVDFSSSGKSFSLIYTRRGQNLFSTPVNIGPLLSSQTYVVAVVHPLGLLSLDVTGYAAVTAGETSRGWHLTSSWICAECAVTGRPTKRCCASSSISITVLMETLNGKCAN